MLAEVSALRYMLLNLFHATAQANAEGKHLLPDFVLKIRDQANTRKLVDARKLLVTTFKPANKAHSVHIIHYDKRKTGTFLGSSSGRINRLYQGFKRIGAKSRWRSVQK